jgi:HK97 gp10 family phage protein
VNLSIDAITGDVERMLSEAERALGLDAIDRVITSAAFDLEGEMKQRAPKDTGFLANSIGAHRVGPGAQDVDIAADYAGHVNYGTVNQKAQPFVEPAIDAVIPRVESHLERLLRQVGGGGGNGD